MLSKYTHLLKSTCLCTLSFTLLLHGAKKYLPLAAFFLCVATTHLAIALYFSIFILFSILYYIHTFRKRVYLLDYACYQPQPHRKCSFQVGESFIQQQKEISQETYDFMLNIYKKSGLGDETYAPPFIFEEDKIPRLQYANQEAEEGVFSSVDALLAKTRIHPSRIDMVIVTCGSFSPSPSISSLIVNHYNLKPDVKTYNLSGMGCGSGVLSIDMAARVLRSSKSAKISLVVITESITLNWYAGANRSMLVTNCIFRVGCTAAFVTSDPSLGRVSKMELVHSLRTHHGADDPSYRSAFQEEDDKGITGVSLKKDLIRVAAKNIREHITILAPRVLPMSQLVQCAYSLALAALSKGGSKQIVPDFTTAFEHMCIHTGGKAVIENVARVLQLSNEVTEPARMSLHRFGNTSSSLVFYELAYLEAKNRVKKGDRMWMIAFGTGFKVGSLVFKWQQDSSQECDNPWLDSIEHYPLNNW